MMRFPVFLVFIRLCTAAATELGADAAEAAAAAEATTAAEVQAAAEDPAKDPCDKTGFDIMATAFEKLMEEKESLPPAGPNTVLLVIDAQNGFTTNTRDTNDVGGFAQVCLVKGNKHHLATLSNIGSEIEAVKRAGGLVIATKDYHPADHCSFFEHHDCHNTRESADNYARKAKTYGAYEYESNRYDNSFPPHCIGTISGETEEGNVPADWTSTGKPAGQVFKAHVLRQTPPVQSGTDLHKTVSDAMSGYERSFIAYKGFSRDFESFGAFPMEGEKADAKMVGSKLWVDANGKPRPYKEFTNPPADAFKTYMSNGKGFASVEDYLRTQEISDVRVVGYVWDFCVKETAIGAVQAGFPNTTVLAYASRPAADGISVGGVPGVPDSGRREEPLLGSTAASVNAFRQMVSNNVKVVKANGAPAALLASTAPLEILREQDNLIRYNVAMFALWVTGVSTMLAGGTAFVYRKFRAHQEIESVYVPFLACE